VIVFYAKISASVFSVFTKRDAGELQSLLALPYYWPTLNSCLRILSGEIFFHQMNSLCMPFLRQPFLMLLLGV